jgi:hypothetical protein
MQLRLSEEASRDYPDEGKRGQAFGEFPQEIGVVNMGGRRDWSIRSIKRSQSGFEIFFGVLLG